MKQERLAPLAPEQQLAWLVAYNEGWLDGVPSDQLAASLGQLFEALKPLSLSLEHSREDWRQAVRAALGGQGDEPAA